MEFISNPQFGNVGPVVFSALLYLFPRVKLEVPVSMLVVCALSITSLLYAFLWQETAMIGDERHRWVFANKSLCPCDH